MRVTAWLSTASSILVLPLLLTGCGETGAAAPIERQTQATTETQSPEPAIRPNGTTAHDVSYRCNSSREGTIVVDVPNLSDLADTLNRIQPCEYDRGVSLATVTVICRSDPLVVQLTGKDGNVAQPSREALCL
jgi:hypothetical protein